MRRAQSTTTVNPPTEDDTARPHPRRLRVSNPATSKAVGAGTATVKGNDWASFAQAVADCFGEQPVRVKDVYLLAEEHLPEVVDDGNEHAARTALGKALARRSGQCFSGLRLETVGRDRHAKVVKYRIRPPGLVDRVRRTMGAASRWLRSCLFPREIAR